MISQAVALRHLASEAVWPCGNPSNKHTNQPTRQPTSLAAAASSVLLVLPATRPRRHWTSRCLQTYAHPHAQQQQVGCGCLVMLSNCWVVKRSIRLHTLNVPQNHVYTRYHAAHTDLMIVGPTAFRNSQVCKVQCQHLYACTRAPGDYTRLPDS